MRRPSPAAQDRAIAQSMASVRFARTTTRKPAHVAAVISARVQASNVRRPAAPSSKQPGQSPSKRRETSLKRITVTPLDPEQANAVLDSIEKHLKSEGVRALLQIDASPDALLLRAALSAVMHAFGERPRGLTPQQQQAINAAHLALQADNMAAIERVANTPRCI